MKNNILRSISINYIISAAALASVPALAAPPVGPHTAAAVMSIEHEWLAALNRRDVKTLARILGRAFIDSDFQGDAITRAQYLAFTDVFIWRDARWQAVTGQETHFTPDQRIQ